MQVVVLTLCGCMSKLNREFPYHVIKHSFCAKHKETSETL